MTAYFNTPELTQIRKAVEDLEKREDDLEDQLKKRELAIATQMASAPQPTPAVPATPTSAPQPATPVPAA